MEFRNSKLERLWHAIFEFGITLKAINGLWESIAGTLLLFVSRARFGRFFYFLARGEISENPHDAFVNLGTRILQNFSHGTKIFVGLYILIHGITNIFLAIQLYRNRLWAYLVTIVVMAIFMLYQVHRIFLYHSVLLSIVTVYDALFAILTWHEYRYQKSLIHGKY